MTSELESVFARLRSILQKHGGALSVADDRPARYCLEASAGPATIKAWGGKVKRPTIPVAWVEIGTAYVSYHLMALNGHAKLLDGMPTDLKARMQGKTCFNFTSVDEALFRELEHVTAQGIAAFRNAGYIEKR